MSKKKSWDEFTNKELVNILSNTHNWKLSQKIMKILEKRGVTLSDQYYGTYDQDAKGEENE